MRARYREEIARTLGEWSGKPAAWGRDDCALAIANIDRRVLGIDTAKGWRGRYRSEAGARRVLGSGGVLCMAKQVAKALKWRRILPPAADDGDRGVATTPSGPTCVIRYRGFWVGRFDRGNVLATDAQIIAAWAIT